MTLKPYPLLGGERVVIRCTANGWPRPQIMWLQDKIQIHTDSSLKIRIKTQSTKNHKQQIVDLEMLNVTTKNGGDYECRASNIVGTKTTEVSSFVSCKYFHICSNYESVFCATHPTIILKRVTVVQSYTHLK